MVRAERLELSHPKILEPKSSASTNSATLALNHQDIIVEKIKSHNTDYTKTCNQLIFLVAPLIV